MERTYPKLDARSANEQTFFSSVQPERVPQIIEKQLKEAILRQHYRPGDKLPPERDLAQIFNTSRSSVREAIRTLERAGFLIIKKGVQGGAFVLEKSKFPSISGHLRDVLRFREVSLEDVLDARLMFEPPIAAEAARKATPAQIALLEEISQKHVQSFDPDNPAIQHDRKPHFHCALAEITGNQVTMMIMETLMEIHAYRMNKFALNLDTLKEINHHHRNIIDCLKRKDSAGACQSMREHILSVHQMHTALEKDQSG